MKVIIVTQLLTLNVSNLITCHYVINKWKLLKSVTQNCFSYPRADRGRPARPASFCRSIEPCPQVPRYSGCVWCRFPSPCLRIHRDPPAAAGAPRYCPPNSTSACCPFNSILVPDLLSFTTSVKPIWQVRNRVYLNFFESSELFRLKSNNTRTCRWRI